MIGLQHLLLICRTVPLHLPPFDTDDILHVGAVTLCSPVTNAVNGLYVMRRIAGQVVA